jgi:hypothetical protein
MTASSTAPGVARAFQFRLATLLGIAGAIIAQMLYATRKPE